MLRWAARSATSCRWAARARRSFTFRTCTLVLKPLTSRSTRASCSVTRSTASMRFSSWSSDSAPSSTSSTAGAAAVDVQRHEPLRERRLRTLQAPARDAEVTRVRDHVRLDPLEPEVRQVVRLDRVRELRVDLPDLVQDVLGLSPLLADGGVGGRRLDGARADCCENHRQQRQDRRRLSQSRTDQRLPAPIATVRASRGTHRGGPVGHKRRTLATRTDACKPQQSRKCPSWRSKFTNHKLTRSGETEASAGVLGSAPRADAIPKGRRTSCCGVYRPGAARCRAGRGRHGRQHRAVQRRRPNGSLPSSSSTRSRASSRRPARRRTRSRHNARTSRGSTPRHEQRLTVARRAAELSTRRLEELVRRLYEHRGVDPLEVLLGSRSLEEALTDLESLELRGGRAEPDPRSARAPRGRSSCASTRSWPPAKASSRRLTAAADAHAGELAARAAAKAAYVESLAAPAEAHRRQVGALEAEASAAQQQAARLQPPAAEPVQALVADPAASPVEPVAGRRRHEDAQGERDRLQPARDGPPPGCRSDTASSRSIRA